MIKTYFATLTSDKGYKDIVTSIKVEEGASDSEMQRKALNQICKKNSWGKDDILTYGYTKISFGEFGKDFVLNMLETEHTVAIILKNGLPIAEAPSKQQAEKVIKQMKADKANEPGIYKIYEVHKWVNEKKADNGYYKLVNKEKEN